MFPVTDFYLFFLLPLLGGEERKHAIYHADREEEKLYAQLTSSNILREEQLALVMRRMIMLTRDEW